MEEPQRIGLSPEINSQFDSMLKELNNEVIGSELIKFDLYRLAVALGIKKGNTPPPINGKTESIFRVNELDPDKALYIATETSRLGYSDEPVYRTVERLGEQGVREICRAYKENMGSIPWNKILD